MRNKKYKASVLAVTFIIMAIILASALSISAVSVRERKDSIGANKSSLSYQKADMGVEKILGVLLTEINADPDKFLSLVDWSPCICSDVEGSKWIVCDNFRVQLKKQTAFPPDEIPAFENIDCDSGTEAVLNVDRIKSVGFDPAGQTQRSVEAEVPVVPAP